MSHFVRPLNLVLALCTHCLLLPECLATFSLPFTGLCQEQTASHLQAQAVLFVSFPLVFPCRTNSVNIWALLLYRCPFIPNCSSSFFLKDRAVLLSFLTFCFPVDLRSSNSILTRNSTTYHNLKNKTRFDLFNIFLPVFKNVIYFVHECSAAYMPEPPGDG